MKIFPFKKSRRLFLLFFSLFYFSSNTFASNFSSKSTLVALSIPVIAGVYSFTSCDYEGLQDLILAGLVTAQITTLLKNSVLRTRPNGENEMSFPSGDAAAAFVGASYLHHRYGLRWGLPMYTIATVIGYERVNTKAHFWSDVIVGALIGYTAGAYFTKGCADVCFVPHFDSENNSYGVQIRLLF